MGWGRETSALPNGRFDEFADSEFVVHIFDASVLPEEMEATMTERSR